MRITFLTHYFPPEGNAPASRVYEMAKRWVASGQDVNVITCVPNVPNGIVYEGYSNKLIQTEVVDGICVTRVWTYIAANKGILKRTLNYVSYMIMASLVGLFIKKPDLIIATSPQFFCGWAGVTLSKLRRLPFILEIRDIWPDSIVAVGAIRNKRLLSFLEKMEIMMYSSADHIVAVGEGYRQKMVEKGVPPEKISIVMNGIDKKVFYPCEPDTMLIKKWGLANKFVCSYVGTVGMASGLETVLHAAKRLKNMRRTDIHFMIVGDGAIRYDLETQARDMGLDNITFTGRQPKELMPKYLSMTDTCLVHLRKSMLFETVMPSKIFEAAGMAKPIIIGVNGYAKKSVLEAKAGIAIESENANELVEAVLRLAGNPEQKRLLGEAGYHHFGNNNDRDNLAQDYQKIIELVNRRAKFKPSVVRV